ncbi:DUF2332 domain-containing protein [Exiguobacterium artemiae]
MTETELAQRFWIFAERECRDSSPLYEYLSLEIAEDPGILDLCRHARDVQPVPNLLFGAVHYLLLKGIDHPLAAYYPSVSKQPKPFHDAFADFKSFCTTYEAELIPLLAQRLVQTNEVRRCTYLYPVFSQIHEQTQQPLALLEIGTSAGLQLLFDQYGYEYGNGETVGNPASRLQLTSVIEGNDTPVIPQTPPPVTMRTGLDLNIVDLNDTDEQLWLKALIWTEHRERLAMFEAAAGYVEELPLKLVEGDGVRLLPHYAAETPDDSILCIFHTHVANQMPLAVKKELLHVVGEIGRTRNLYHVYNNVQDRYLHLDAYIDGVLTEQTIAETDGHGRWFKWLVTQEV